MPIRAHAAGSRVSPRLGSRSHAWTPTSTVLPIHDRGRAGDPLHTCSRGCTRMTLRVRRRAVYRVYGEDEFLGGVCGVDSCERVGSGVGERRLRRLAGAAMLAGAVGVVGGAIVTTTMSSGRGAVRKLRAGSRPAEGRSASGTELRAPIYTARRRTSSALSLRHDARAPASRPMVAAAPTLRVAIAREQEPTSAEPSVAGDAAPGRRERVEFGFER
jgi:hypothetical protein